MEEEIQGKYLGYLDSIQGLINDIQSGAVQGVPEQKLAELNTLYKQAQDRFTQGIGAYQPMVDTATGTIGSGVGVLDKAATAFEGLGQAPTLEQIQPFINPYQSVIQDEINRAYDVAANKASAEVSEHMSIYGLFPMGNAYLRFGLVKASIDTTEKLATGTVYGNEDVDGKILGLGYQKDLPMAFLRVEGTYTDYDDVKYLGTLDSDSVRNTIEADVDATAIKVSLGRAF